MTREDHEERVVRAFFQRPRQDRFLALLAKPSSRDRALDKLNHRAPLDPKYMQLLAPRDQSVERIVRMLVERGAPAICYVLSESSELDRRTSSLVQALAALVGSGYSGIVSCVAGELAYYEGEEKASATSSPAPPVSVIRFGNTNRCVGWR